MPISGSQLRKQKLLYKSRTKIIRRKVKFKTSVFNKPNTIHKPYRQQIKKHEADKKRFYRDKYTAHLRKAVFLQDYKKLRIFLKKRKFHRYYIFLSSDLWQSFKSSYYREHSKVCDICGSRSMIDLHHVEYGDLLDEKNVRPLCRECHKQAHVFALEEDQTLLSTFERFKDWKKANLGKEVILNSPFMTDYFNSL